MRSEELVRAALGNLSCDEAEGPIRHAHLAAEARERAGARSFFPKPLDLARGLGLRVHVQPDLAAPVAVASDLIVVRAEADGRERGWWMFHGIAAALLERWVGAHADKDVVLLAVELGAPSAIARHMEDAALARAQPWLPLWALFHAARGRHT